MIAFKPGPATLPVPDEAIAALVHYKESCALSYDDMAARMKIGKQSLEAVIRDRRGVKRETHMRIMRFVKRLERKVERKVEKE